MAEIINPELEVKPATVEELQAKLDEQKSLSEQEKSGLVEQIKELRKKNQELAAAKIDPVVPVEGDEVDKKIQSALLKEKNERIEQNRKIALQKFVSKHPEFNPDNDLGGIKNDILMSSYKRLNTQNSVSEGEIYDDFEAALLIMSKSISKDGKSILSEFATTPINGEKPRTTDKIVLSSEQEELRKKKGWTVEKYFDMKAKYPKIII